jgi:hypothetical protein
VFVHKSVALVLLIEASAAWAHNFNIILEFPFNKAHKFFDTIHVNWGKYIAMHSTSIHLIKQCTKHTNPLLYTDSKPIFNEAKKNDTDRTYLKLQDDVQVRRRGALGSNGRGARASGWHVRHTPEVGVASELQDGAPKMRSNRAQPKAWVEPDLQDGTKGEGGCRRRNGGRCGMPPPRHQRRCGMRCRSNGGRCGWMAGDGDEAGRVKFSTSMERDISKVFTIQTQTNMWCTGE